MIERENHTQSKLFFSDSGNKYGMLSRQLKSVNINMPIIQVHLLLCSVFAQRANKHEFVSMSAYLIERLTALSDSAAPQE